MTGRFEFLLGLPALRPGALWSRATATLGAPVMISANALSPLARRQAGAARMGWILTASHLNLVSYATG